MGQCGAEKNANVFVVLVKEIMLIKEQLPDRHLKTNLKNVFLYYLGLFLFLHLYKVYIYNHHKYKEFLAYSFDSVRV